MSDVTGGSLTQSSLANVQPKFFSLAAEKDVITLLRHIHQSPLDPDAKNELRDAVFVFRNSPNATRTPELTAMFAEHGFNLSENSKEEDVLPQAVLPAPKPLGQFGTTRPSPSFSKQTVVVTPEIIVAPTVKAEPVVQEVVAPIPVVPVVTPASPVSEPVVPVPPVPPKTPEPMIAEVSVAAPVAPLPTPPPVETTASVPSTVGVLDRIKEIKKQVNLLVGNPVNLISDHDEIGREYMNALLDAMKKNNGGTSDEVSQAMSRLEIAYTSVTDTVGAAARDVPVAPAVVSTPVPTPEAEVVTDKIEVPVAVVPDVVEPEEFPVPEEPVLSGFASVHQTHVEEPAVESAPEVVPEVAVTVPVPEAESVITAPQDPEPPVPDAKTVATSEESVEHKTSVPIAGGIMSVAKEKQIQDLMTAEKLQAATTDQQKRAIEIASMNPLMTPEVTNGLQQLLSEWTLFKSSGIFGTGPNGIEHPLFKKLSILNMTAVVAGRFEGATPVIKRSITDYMNGWRYEEGIMQEQGELFEHYLRRVIKHILDKRVK
jgi:hypothetical protein